MGVTASAVRLTPWALAIVQTGLLGWLLRRHGRALPAYAKLHDRVARVEHALNELAWGPAVLDPRPVPDGTPDTALMYRTVTLKNGARFEVALDARRMDPITDAIVDGESW